MKQCCYSDVSIAPDNTGLIYAVGSDKTLKQMQGDQMLKEVDLHTLTLSSVVQSHDGSMLFRYYLHIVFSLTKYIHKLHFKYFYL